MKTIPRRQLPRRVRQIEHTLIPMPDGANLAARIWLPRDAEQDPVPAIFEFIPYRKGDGTIRRDSVTHPYLAGHGYACVRVDLRGSGESDGVLTDEYLQQELDDGAEVIRWLGKQPWCTGRVGMMGISWGGFNGLQIAAMRPPGLEAVITLCSTDDRYADDVHYMGGCLLGDNLSWASIMFAHNSCPPDPALVGDRWRDMWFERLRGSGLWLETWLRHQHRDDYWKHGSVCEDFSAIRCPVLAVSGWADGYSNSVLRLLTHLQVPRKGLIGPWSHVYPHFGKPGPAIGFLQESLRWWDRWLKDEETGVEHDPMLRVWMQDSVPPTTNYGHRPGRWVAEDSWPSTRMEPRRFGLAAPGRILPEPGGEDEGEPMTIQSPLSVGLFAGKWCSYPAPPDLPHDQREEDGGALVFDSAPLPEDMEILGQPSVELDLSCSKPVGMVAVRLSDVAPDDRATRITYGLLNLTHRNSHEEPEHPPQLPRGAGAPGARAAVPRARVPERHRTGLPGRPPVPHLALHLLLAARLAGAGAGTAHHPPRRQPRDAPRAPAPGRGRRPAPLPRARGNAGRGGDPAGSSAAQLDRDPRPGGGSVDPRGDRRRGRLSAGSERHRAGASRRGAI